MHHIIHVLAAILVGTAIGAMLGPRSNFLFISSLVAIALGVLTIVTPSWLPLAIGTAVFLIAYIVPNNTRPARA